MSRMSSALPKSLTVPDTANALMQNRINISIIFNYLRERGVAYRAQIARDLGLSAPAVSRAIERLLRDEYVIESEKVQVENGRMAAKVMVNAGRGFIVGVDLLAEPARIAISDFSGDLKHESVALPFDERSPYSEYLVAAIRRAIKAYGELGAKKGKNVLAIGVGVPAVVDPQSGAILSASLYENILSTNLSDNLLHAFKVPIFIENISNLAAIGEWKRGVGRNVRNMLFVEIGNGIGAGIILDGNLYRGTLGSAGEIGYFISEPAGLGHDNSQGGYLENRASLAALRRPGMRPGGFADDGAAATLFEAAGKGSDEALRTIGDATRHLAVAIVNTMIVLNPELVIIGGAACEMPEADRLMIRPLIEEVRRNYPFVPAAICPASLGIKASLIGAVQLALDALVVHAYPYRL